MFTRCPTLGTQELVSSLAATTSTAGRSLNQVLKILYGLNNKIALLKYSKQGLKLWTRKWASLGIALRCNLVI